MSRSTGGARRRWAARNGHRGTTIPRYSAWSLIRHGVSGDDWPPILRRHDRRDSYDVVIIGGGVHGLATAYHLATDHGVRNVAVLEKSYIGSGGSGRNTAILRSNYLTPRACGSTTAR